MNVVYLIHTSRKSAASIREWHTMRKLGFQQDFNPKKPQIVQKYNGITVGSTFWGGSYQESYWSHSPCGFPAQAELEAAVLKVQKMIDAKETAEVGKLFFIVQISRREEEEILTKETGCLWGVLLIFGHCIGLWWDYVLLH